jgi:hypothetical protein
MLSLGKITGCRIRLLRKDYEMSSKAKEKKSPAYKTQIDAENEIYEFRKGFESPKFRKKLDEWEGSLLSQLGDHQIPHS